MTRTPFPENPLFMVAGFLVAGFHFLFVYVFTALACEKDFAGLRVAGLGIVPAVNSLVTLVALALTTVLLLRCLTLLRRDEPKPEDVAPPHLFLIWMCTGVAALSLIAIIWNGIPILMVPACPQDL